MTKALKISLAQVNQFIGNFEHQYNMIIQNIIKADNEKADLIIFPELTLTGYSPEDLVLRPKFRQAAKYYFEKLLEFSRSCEVAIIVGNIFEDDNKLYNCAYLIQRGKILIQTLKTNLPNYGVFDEKRNFCPCSTTSVAEFKGCKLGIVICEDMWQGSSVTNLTQAGAEIIIVINASPFETDKFERRIKLANTHTKTTNAALIYVNYVGGQDHIVYDGGSFIMNEKGEVILQAPFWQEQLATTTLSFDKTWKATCYVNAKIPELSENIYSALVTGLQDYLKKNGFKDVVLGLSGGIDSALVTAIAVDALGKDHVHPVYLPSKFTAKQSFEDSDLLLAKLDIKPELINIEPLVTQSLTDLAPNFEGKKPDLTEENLQSRIRGLLLMALSNKNNWLLLSTGNKSELAVGYATIYGDMCGGYNVLKDVYKTKVYEVANWRNNHKPSHFLGPDGVVIPHSIIARAPTAELRNDQKDSDSLPEYPVLDKILEMFIEQKKSAEDIIACGFDETIVRKIIRLFFIAEYKRKQSCPGVKVTKMYFGADWRYPISHGFEG